MANGDVVISATIDEKEIENSLKKIEVSVTVSCDKIADSFDKMISRIEGSFKGISSAGKEVEKLTDTIKAPKNELEELNKYFRELEKADLSKVGESLNIEPAIANSLFRLKELNAEIDTIQKIRVETGGEAGSAQELRQRTIEVNQLHAAMTALQTTQQKLNQPDQFVAYTKSLTEPNAQLKRMSEYYKDLEKTTLATAKEQERASNIIQKALEKENKERERALKLAEKKAIPIYAGAIDMPSASINERIEKIKALQQVQKSLSTTDADYAIKLRTVNAELQRLKRANTEALTTGVELEKRTNKLADAFANLGRRLLVYASIGAATGFVKSLAQIRGQYELLERSLGAIIQDYGKATQIFQQQQAEALKSPFTLIDLATATKQLAAYRIATDELVPTTKMLADISAGLGVEMERLVYNFGQVKAQTVLNARDLRDFANMGLPVLQELTKYYSQLQGRIVSTGEVFSMVSNRMVSFGDVEMILKKLTSEGGQFFNMQAIQAETLKGQLGNLQDAYEQMLNAIGKENQGTLTNAVGLVRTLIDNWQIVISVLGKLIVVYGLYRVAILLADKNLIRYYATLSRTNAASIKQLSLLQLLQVGFVKFGRAIASAAIAMKGFIASNVYLLAFALLAEGIMSLVGNLREQAEIQEEIRKKTEQNTLKLNEITNAYNDATKAAQSYRKTQKDISDDDPKLKEYFGKRLTELKALADTAQQEYNIPYIIDFGTVDASNIDEYFQKYLDYVDEAKRRTHDMEVVFGELQKWTSGGEFWGNTIEKDLTQLKESFDNLFAGNLKGQLDAIGLSLSENAQQMFTTYRNGLSYFDSAKGYLIQQFNEQKKATESVDEYNQKRLELLKLIKGSGEEAKKFNNYIDFSRNGTLKSINGLTDAFDKFTRHQNEASKELGNYIDEVLKKWNTTVDKLTEPQKIQLTALIDTFIANRSMQGFMAEWTGKTLRMKLQIDPGTGFSMVPQTLAETWKEQLKKIEGYQDVFTSDTQIEDLKGLVDLGKTLNDEWNKALDAKKELAKQKPTSPESIKQQEQELNVLEKQIIASEAIADFFGIALEKKTKGAKRDVLAEAIKDEVTWIEKLRKEYDELTKSGKSSAETVKFLTNTFGDNIKAINENLKKVKQQPLDLNKIFLGADGKGITDKTSLDRSVLNYLKTVRDSIENKSSDAFKDISLKIQELEVVVEKSKFTGLTESLNQALSNIQAGFELGIEIESLPEGMGDIFMKMLRIDPKDVITSMDQFRNALQTEIDRTLAQLNKLNETDIQFKVGEISSAALAAMFAVPKGLSEEATTAWNEMVKVLTKGNDLMLKANEKYATEAVNNLQTLLTKYGSFDARRKEAAQIAAKELLDIEKRYTDGAIGEAKRRELKTAVERKEAKTIATISFEEFKESDEWIKAFEDLDRLSTESINNIMDKLKDFIDTQTDLSPTEIKELTNAYKKLREEVGQRNPFKLISDGLKSIKDATGDERRAALSDISQGVNEIGNAGNQALNAVTGFADALGIEFSDDMQKRLEGIGDVFDGLASIDLTKPMSIITSGFKIIGGLVKTIFGEGKNAKITRSIQQSERAVKSLQNTYKGLERAVDKALGDAVVGANKALIANLELQKVEIQRQIQLEKSRKKKKQDAEKIADLQQQLQELNWQIIDTLSDLRDKLLGITDSEVIDNLATALKEAFKAGESGAEAWGKSVKEIINDMVYSMLVAKFLAPKIAEELDKYWETLMPKTAAAEAAAAKVTDLDTQIAELEAKQEDETSWIGRALTKKEREATQNQINELKKQREQAIADRNKAISLAENEIPNATEAGVLAFEEGMNQLGIYAENIIPDWLKDRFLATAEDKLSGLQKGIANITEQTAGEIESKMNILTFNSYESIDLQKQMLITQQANLGITSNLLLTARESYQLMEAMYNWTQSITAATGGTGGLGIKTYLQN